VAFQRLNLRLLKSYYVATNEASEVIHHLFRFQEVGRIPEMIWDRDQYVDYVTTVLRRENRQQHARGDMGNRPGVKRVIERNVHACLFCRSDRA
jgi:hypothetical protein